VIGYGGKTINTLRLWSAATPHFFDFQQFSSGDFVGALAETLTAETLTRVLYPDDSTAEGKARASSNTPRGLHAGRRPSAARAAGND
jgi:glucan phosphorylase